MSDCKPKRGRRGKTILDRLREADPDAYPGDHMHGPIRTEPAPAFVPGDAYEGPPPKSAPTPPKGRFVFTDSTTFAGADYRPEWLIRGALVKGQPAVVAGPSKSLKTSLLIDAAVSLAAGGRFLDRFDVPARVRVAVVSGESGPHTLQETAARVCRAKGLDLAGLGDRLVWCDTLPTFADLGVMAEFADALAGVGADVAVIDPAYLCLGPVDAKNLFEMGAVLRIVAESLLRVGCTPVIAHHANRGLQTGEPMELHHLAYSGLEQFARQFWLLNRREPYRSDGRHNLWVRVGGSAGHGGLWAVDITEGTIGDDFTGRTWDVTVQSAGEAQADRIAGREAEKERAARVKLEAGWVKVLDAIDAEVMAGKPGATVSAIKKRCPSMDGTKVRAMLNDLIEDGRIVPVEVTVTVGSGTKRTTEGYRRRSSGASGVSGLPMLAPDDPS